MICRLVNDRLGGLVLPAHLEKLGVIGNIGRLWMKLSFSLLWPEFNVCLLEGTMFMKLNVGHRNGTFSKMIIT